MSYLTLCMTGAMISISICLARARSQTVPCLVTLSMLSFVPSRVNIAGEQLLALTTPLKQSRERGCSGVLGLPRKPNGTWVSGCDMLARLCLAELAKVRVEYAQIIRRRGLVRVTCEVLTSIAAASIQAVTKVDDRRAWSCFLHMPPPPDRSCHCQSGISRKITACSGAALHIRFSTLGDLREP